MKVIILAGGFGTRLSEYTEMTPKPMVTVGSQPILWHIMQSYAHFGHKDFYIALGYKAEVIKEYFLNYHSLNSDFTVDLTVYASIDADEEPEVIAQSNCPRISDKGLSVLVKPGIKKSSIFIIQAGCGLNVNCINELPFMALTIE